MRGTIGHASTKLVPRFTQLGLHVDLGVLWVGDQYAHLLRFEHHLKRLCVCLEANIPKGSTDVATIDRDIYLIREDLQVTAWSRLERENSLRILAVVYADECAIVTPFPRS